MDLNASRLREAIADFPDLQPVLDPQDAETVERPSDPTVLTFLVDEVRGVAGAAFSGYSSAFINNLLYAVLFAFACNYLWALPLSQVVDVSLAFFLVITGLMIALNVVFLATALGRGDFYVSLYFAVIAILSGLLPFASVFGFTVYGWFVDGDWTASSSVYQWYVGVFGSAYQWLVSSVGDVLGLMTVETDASGLDVSKVNTELLVQWAQISAAVVAISEFILKRVARTA
jgi:hypothetical protein